MNQTGTLQVELALAEQLLRAEAAHLQELEEKRRLIADGLADLAAPSELWEQYLMEINDQIERAGRRLQALQQLRESLRARLDGTPRA